MELPPDGDGHDAPSRDTQMQADPTHQRLQTLMESFLERMDQRLTRLEYHITWITTNPAMRAFQVVNQMPAQVGFPLFPHLPLEIRNRIWGFCIPQRAFKVLDAVSDTRPLQGPVLSSGLPPPIISCVCRESRSVSRRTGRMYRLVYDVHGDAIPRHLQEPFGYWTWFDSDHDVFELSKLDEEAQPIIGLDTLIQQVKHVLINIAHDLEDFVQDFAEVFQFGLYCRNLQTISLTTGIRQVNPTQTPLILHSGLVIRSVYTFRLESPSRPINSYNERDVLR